MDTKKCIFREFLQRGLASIFTCSPLPFSFFFIPGILVRMGERVAIERERVREREMRCFNTPLPSSLHPTPPHTWDGHFISECSKWKGDLNLPCFPLTPLPLSISHTQSLILLMDSTLLVSEPAASTPNVLIEEYWLHISWLLPRRNLALTLKTSAFVCFVVLQDKRPDAVYLPPPPGG